MEYQYPEVRQRLAQVIFELINKSEFLGVNIVSMKLVETTMFPFPMAVNNTEVFYNPEIIIQHKFDNKDLRFIFAHEAMHVLQKSVSRITQFQEEHESQIRQGLMVNRTAMLYNIASDLAINSILVNDGWEQPDKEGWTPCVPGFRTYRHLPPLKDTEWYFAYLLRMEKQHQEQEQQRKNNGDDDETSSGEDQEDEGGDSGASGDDEGEDSGESDSDGEEEEETPYDDDGEEDESEESGNSGSGRGKGKGGKKSGRRSGDNDGGDEEDDDTDDTDSETGDSPDTVPDAVQKEVKNGGRSGETDDGRAVTELPIEELLKVLEQYPADIIPDQKENKVSESAINQKIALSIGLSGGYGNTHVLSCMERKLAEQLRPAEISWQRALRMYLTAKDRSSTSYRRPSRRRDEPPMFFPSRNSQTLGTTFLVADVSGSMYEYIQPVVVELHSLFSGFRNTSFTMVLVDTMIRKVFEFRKGMPIPNVHDWHIIGFGSTDMAPGFLEAEKKNPSLIICTTDLEFGGYFPPKPRCPVLWIVPDDERHRAIPVPYGNVVYFNPNAK